MTRESRNGVTVGPLQREAGLTLIEVLAPMIILAAGLLVLLPMATLSIGANMQARDMVDYQRATVSCELLPSASVSICVFR